MPRLSKEERKEVTELIKNGWSLRAVAKKMKRSRNTIHHLVKKYKTTGSIDDRPRSGRPRVMPLHEDSWFECVGQERPYVCTECGKTFKKMPGLKDHIRIHGGKRNFQCDQCGRSFLSSATFTRHQRTHTGEKPYICEYCARSFADMKTMRTHIRTHTGERPHKCHLCDHACTTAGNLHAHMKVHRDKNGQIPRPINVKLPIAKTVPICPAKDLRKARRKFKKYSEESWCDGDSSSERESDSASKEESPLSKNDQLSVDLEEKLQCDNDPFTYKISQGGDLHCDKDPFTYKTSQGWDLQYDKDPFTYKTSQGGEEQSLDEETPGQERCQVLVKCENDADVSERVSQLVSSENCSSPEQQEDPVLEQDTCIPEENIKSNADMSERVSQFISSEVSSSPKQQEDPILEQDTCIPEENTKSDADVSERNIVPGAMPRLSKEERNQVTELIKNGWSIRAVAKKMKRSRNTIHHLVKKYKTTGSIDDRPRSGRPRIKPVCEDSWFECVGQERPYVCTECGKTFKKMPGLKEHIRIHGEERDFQCDQCGRSFLSSATFLRHQRTHTGEKPYICEYCACSFADMGTMRTHIRTHTGERPHKCHLCDHSCTTAGNLHAHMKVHRDKNGQVPRPVNVRLPIRKTIPICSEKDLLRKARRKFKKYSEESWRDGDSSSERESESASKEESPLSENSQLSNNIDEKLQGDKDLCNFKTSQGGDLQCDSCPFTYKTSQSWDVQSLNEETSGQERCQVVVKCENETDVSERVSQFISSEVSSSPEQQEDPVLEQDTCIPEENIKKEPVSSDEN